LHELIKRSQATTHLTENNAGKNFQGECSRRGIFRRESSEGNFQRKIYAEEIFEEFVGEKLRRFKKVTIRFGPVFDALSVVENLSQLAPANQHIAAILRKLVNEPRVGHCAISSD
jgi:hypothetical protein